MEGKANDAAAYEEFEPFCKWQRKEDHDLLEIHLQEFKREQLKVQISNYGILKISGERTTSSDASKKTRFYKEAAVPSSKYDTPAIRARFVNGCLYITLPKWKSSAPDVNANMTPKREETPKRPAAELTAKDQPKASPDPKEQAVSSSGGSEFEFQGRKREPELGRRVAKVAVSLAATAAAVAVFVAYVVYMCKATVGEVYDD
ncbi:hypothetical protein Salat_1027600 [Sesamum alatum]|uniref:SHSP domain-containing protein n=1 Tax=Sesamum alatum TaxID=300844 RepID=A0AAE1YMC1_9LAMI|nr:hypothetical protein Salat_1027600 [Sesamum alatum]